MNRTCNHFKRICLTLIMGFFLIALSSVAFAQSAPTLDQLEKQLFSRTFVGEPENQRLERLESIVFGSPSAGMPKGQRLQQLGQFLENPAKAAPPHPVQQPTQTPYVSQKSLPQQPAPAVPGESGYPVVSTMEQQLFNRTFEGDSLEIRLGRLEKKTLGQVQVGTLSERTDQLRLMVLGNTGNAPTYSAGVPTAPVSPGAGYGPIEFQKSQMASADVTAALPELGEKK